jgi:streptogramin lyase
MGNLFAGPGVQLTMRRVSVLALATARQQHGQERQSEQHDASVHDQSYGRGVRAVFLLLLLSFLVLIANAAAAPPRPVARIVTGTAPCGIAAGLGSVWVALYGTGKLVRIDPRSNRVVRRITVGRGICQLAIAAGSVWAASDKTNVLYRVSPRNGRVVARIPVGAWPADLEFAFRSLWISAYQQGKVARIDTRTNRVIRMYDVGGNPAGLARAGDSLWVAFGRQGTSLGRLDPATGALTKTGIGHTGPGFLTLAAGSLWTTTADGYAVRVDPASRRVLATFAIPGTPAEVATAPDGKIWVAEKERNTVTRIDPRTNSVVDVTAAGRGAFSIAVAAGDMWVTSFAGVDVWRFRGK